MTARSVLFACDLDSQIFGAKPLAHAFLRRGWRVMFSIDDLSGLPAELRKQLQDEFETIERPLGEVAIDPGALAHDAIGVFATGSRIALFRHAIELAARAHDERRPALFCGFNGLVFEKFEEGVAWRLGYDVLCLNGPRDLEMFRNMVSPTPFAGQPAEVTGLRRRTHARVPQQADAPADRRKLFVFAEQVAVPSDLAERRRLVSLLARLASASPDWDVALKARVRPSERTFYDQVGHVERLSGALSDRPANLVVTYEPLDRLLERADLFATISSTALFDALDAQVPCLIAADFGLRNGHGTHVFFGSGLMTEFGRLPSLDAAPTLVPDPRWLDWIGYGDAHTPDALVDRLEAGVPPQAPPSFVPFTAAARGAAPSRELAEAIIEAGNAAEAALVSRNQADARAALGRLGAAAAKADRERSLNAAWRAREGGLAALARRFGLYWAYKRIRRALLGEAPK